MNFPKALNVDFLEENRFGSCGFGLHHSLKCFRLRLLRKCGVPAGVSLSQLCGREGRAFPPGLNPTVVFEVDGPEPGLRAC